MQYYEVLKNLRIDRDKSQKEIAELLQTTQTYYCKYELGKHPLPINHLITLCRLCPWTAQGSSLRSEQNQINALSIVPSFEFRFGNPGYVSL